MLIMRDYNRIIEALDIKFIKVRHIKILQALTIENFYDVANILIILNNGQLSFLEENQQHKVASGEILFIPGGKSTTLTYGSGAPINFNNDYLINNSWEYFQEMQKAASDTPFDNFSYITFDAKIFSSVNFFTSLDIPAFIIKENNRISAIGKSILTESGAEAVGSNRMVQVSTEQLVIEIIRHMLNRNFFTKKLAMNSNYFEDMRILNIFSYVKKHLADDLSNRKLANAAQVSEDYVGQYFKMITGINPQDYVENQRMEHAVKLLRTTKKDIGSISKEVGFKDTAYFCRRFKMMFNMTAGELRRTETLMSF